MNKIPERAHLIRVKKCITHEMFVDSKDPKQLVEWMERTMYEEGGQFIYTERKEMPALFERVNNPVMHLEEFSLTLALVDPLAYAHLYKFYMEYNGPEIDKRKSAGSTPVDLLSELLSQAVPKGVHEEFLKKKHETVQRLKIAYETAIIIGDQDMEAVAKTAVMSFLDANIFEVLDILEDAFYKKAGGIYDKQEV